MPSVNAVDRRLSDIVDPRYEKAMSEINAQKAYDNDFGAAPEGISSESVLGNFEDSLRLLCATLKNQDPTNPMDVKDMSQQFSIVAQTQGIVEVKEILQKMSASSEVSKMLQAAQNLDNLVKIKGDEFMYSPHEQVELGFYAPPETEKASYIITDSKDHVVRIIEGEVETTGDGFHGLVWDGRDNEGQAVRPGKYKFRVSLVGADGDILRDTKGEPLAATTTVMGRVSGSDLKGGKPRYAIAGQHYDMTDLISVQSAQIYQEKLGLSGELLRKTADDREGQAGSLAQALEDQARRSIGEEDLHL
tara:strand:+ start:640 stop:1551 length:912 start_codon:yes stop_codon:yes gene_type:complete